MENSSAISRCLEIFWTFFKIGLFTFGGGYAMIPLIEAEIIERRRWLSKDDFFDLVTVAQTCPGIFAVNMSIFIGFRLRHLRGAFISALGTALPSFLIILFLAIFFEKFKEIELVEAVFRGIRPAVVALIAVPALKLARQAKLTIKTMWIPIVSAGLIYVLGISPIIVIFLAGLFGFLSWKIGERRA